MLEEDLTCTLDRVRMSNHIGGGCTDSSLTTPKWVISCQIEISAFTTDKEIRSKIDLTKEAGQGRAGQDRTGRGSHSGVRGLNRHHCVQWFKPGNANIVTRSPHENVNHIRQEECVRMSCKLLHIIVARHQCCTGIIVFLAFSPTSRISTAHFLIAPLKAFLMCITHECLRRQVKNLL